MSSHHLMNVRPLLQAHHDCFCNDTIWSGCADYSQALGFGTVHNSKHLILHVAGVAECAAAQSQRRRAQWQTG